MDCVEGIMILIITKREIRNIYKKYCDTHKVSGVGDKAIKSNTTRDVWCI